MTEKKVKKNNWFKQFMIFLLVVVVAVSLGLIIFYFTQDGERIEKNKSKIQVNAGKTFSVELTQKKYKSSTKIDCEFDAKALSLAKEPTSKVNGKDKVTTFEFAAKSVNDDIVAGDYKITFKTNARDKASRELAVEVVIADGVSQAFFIGDAEQLQSIGTGDDNVAGEFGASKNYELTQDIDLSTLNGQEGKYSWEPLKNFSGTLNGKGKKISNLYIDAKDEKAGTDLGLFATLDSKAKVYDVEFVDAQILSEDKAVNAGIVAGEAAGTIERVKISATKADSTKIQIGGKDGDNYSLKDKVNVGAVAGVLKREGTMPLIDRVAVQSKVSILVASGAGADLTNPSASDYESKDSYVGGIVGLVQNGTIYNSYCQGFVSVDGPKVFGAGIAGKLQSNAPAENKEAIITSKKSNIINSYTTADVQAASIAEQGNIGAVIAKNENLGILANIETSTTARTYAKDQNAAGVSIASKNAANNAQYQEFKTQITNQAATAEFLVHDKVKGEDVTQTFNVVHENRLVGVYYAKKNDLNWYKHNESTLAAMSDLVVADLDKDGNAIKLISSSMPSKADDFKTYDYSKNKTTWDFNNIWEFKSGSTTPTLRMTEYTETMDVYDPQADAEANKAMDAHTAPVLA